MLAWFPDLLGKRNRLRTVTIPAGVKARLDFWMTDAGITAGPLFRPVTKAGLVQGSGIRDENAIWRLVVRYARETNLGKLPPHDLRVHARNCAVKQVGIWNRFSRCPVMLRSDDGTVSRDDPLRVYSASAMCPQ